MSEPNPGPGQLDRLPPEMQLFMTLSRRYPVFEETAYQALMERADQAQVEKMSPEQLAEWRRHIWPKFDVEIPLGSGESDTFQLTGIDGPGYANGTNEPFYEIYGYLSKDGEPYMPEGVPRIDGFEDDNQLGIYIAAEHPPFLVGPDDQDKIDGSLGDATGALELMRQEGRQPVLLSPEACQELTKALLEVEVDPNQTLALNDLPSLDSI